MSKLRLPRAMFAHSLKVWALALVAMGLFYLLMPYLPRWLFVTLFFMFGVLVFLPAVFGVGPIGRLVGKRLNEAAISDARAQRQPGGDESTRS